MERGKYIVLEGGEASGKSTQVKRLAARLGEEGIKATVLREPGSTEAGEVIRTIIKDGTIPRAPQTNNLLFAAARADLAELEIRPRLEAGEWVLSDRNWWSTAAYQGFGEGLPIEEIRTASGLALHELIKPDLQIVLDVSPAEARQRLELRGGTDYFEAQGEDFHERVYQGYQELCRKLGGIAISGSGTQIQVEERIWAQIEPLVAETAK